MRQLTYYIPIERMGRASQIQALVAKEAINVNGSCLVTYESLHTAAEIFSNMVVTLFVKPERCDYIHRAMQQVIAVTLGLYSPDTGIVRVTDNPVDMRDFNVKEIL